MRTYMAKKEKIERQWFLIDAKDQILGKLAVALAKLLMGKNKPIFTSHVDCGDFVIVLNADKIKLSAECCQRTSWENKCLKNSKSTKSRNTGMRRSSRRQLQSAK